MSTPTLVRRVQRAIGSAIRDRVAGPDADSRGWAVWGAPGPRWFTPQDPISLVHADATMFAAGITALLLQSLHPLAMAGVAGHSGFRSNPWGRLQNTSGFIAMTTFGPIDAAEQLIDQVVRVHNRVRGKDAKGRPYQANDPDLLRWVHVAEAWSFLRVHQRFSPQQLSAQQYDQYVAQTTLVGHKLGAVELPVTVADLESALNGYRSQLEVTPACLDAADFLLREPPLSGTAILGYRMLTAGGISCLPDWARSMLQIPDSPVRQRARRIAGVTGIRLTGWALDSVRDDKLLTGQRIGQPRPAGT